MVGRSQVLLHAHALSVLDHHWRAAPIHWRIRLRGHSQAWRFHLLLWLRRSESSLLASDLPILAYLSDLCWLLLSENWHRVLMMLPNVLLVLIEVVSLRKFLFWFLLLIVLRLIELLLSSQLLLSTMLLVELLMRLMWSDLRVVRFLILVRSVLRSTDKIEWLRLRLGLGIVKLIRLSLLLLP